MASLWPLLKAGINKGLYSCEETKIKRNEVRIYGIYNTRLAVIVKPIFSSSDIWEQNPEIFYHDRVRKVPFTENMQSLLGYLRAFEEDEGFRLIHVQAKDIVVDMMF